MGLLRRRTSRRWAVGAIAIATAIAAAWTSGFDARAGERISNQLDIVRSQVSADPSVAAGEGWVMTDPRDPNHTTVDWLATKDQSDPAALLT